MHAQIIIMINIVDKLKLNFLLNDADIFMWYKSHVLSQPLWLYKTRTREVNAAQDVVAPIQKDSKVKTQ